MRKDTTPLERYDAGEDVPAGDMVLQAAGLAVSTLFRGMFGAIVGGAAFLGICMIVL